MRPAAAACDLDSRRWRPGQRVEQFLDATRNASLKKLSAPILANFFTAAAAARQFEQAAAPIQSVPYTAEEAALLRDLQLLDADAPGEPVAAPAPPEIRRIVIVIVESLAAAFLHSENPAIPAEATPFLDSLVGRYPHLDRFFTSNMPSDWGLNSLLLSRLRPVGMAGVRRTLGTADQAGFESFFVRAVSKQYGNELYTYPHVSDGSLHRP
jgi:hypothetical protein